MLYDLYYDSQDCQGIPLDIIPRIENQQQIVKNQTSFKDILRPQSIPNSVSIEFLPNATFLHSPDCLVLDYSLLNNSICDGFPYNSPECNYDRGDCCEESCQGLLCGQNGFDCQEKSPQHAVANSISTTVNSLSTLRPESFVRTCQYSANNTNNTLQNYVACDVEVCPDNLVQFDGCGCEGNSYF